MDASGPVMPLGPLPSYGHCHHPAFRGPSPCVPSSAEIGHHGLPPWWGRGGQVELGGAGCRPHSDKGCAREAEETWRESVAGPWDALRPPRAPLPREGLCTLDMQLRVHSRELLPRCQPVPPGGQSRRASGQGPGGGVTSLLLRRQARRPTPRATVPGSLCKGQNERRARRSLQACSSFKGKRRFEQGVHQQHSHNQV